MKKILLIIAIAFCIFQMLVLATAIDMGSPAVDGDSLTGGNKTVIEKTNPANESGTITSVEVWFWASVTNVWFATFEQISLNRFTTRGIQSVGNVGAGYHQFDVDIPVEAGDFIGVYLSGGGLDLTTTGSIEPWYTISMAIPCTDKYFSNLSAFKVSLYAIGVTEEEEVEVNVIFMGTNL